MECKRLKEFPYYKIYENGEVWRMAHRSAFGINLKRMKLTPYKTKNNYLMVSLHDREGKRKRFYLHRLVYMAFFGDIPKGLEIDHILNDKANCSVSNLRLASHVNNCKNPNSIARYKAANALEKGKYDLNRLLAARGEKREEELKELFKVMCREKGKVKVMEFMQRGHCGYYRAVRIIKEMTEKVSDKLTKSEDMM
jgi:hypothetical protein